MQAAGVDEIWAFCYAKDKNLPDSMKGMPGVGSIWNWVAIEATTKLIVSWQLGARDAANAHRFIGDIADRINSRVQMTTDGNQGLCRRGRGPSGRQRRLRDAGQAVRQTDSPERAYSPAKCLGTKKKHIDGDRDMALVSTTYAERQNLNIRMQNRRYTRLTNAFSKKAEMLAYSVAIMFCYHNFVRVHMTIKTTPAIAAGIAKQRWTVGDMVDLLPEVVGGPRGPYKKRNSD
jgi:IS1 family transposase